MLDSVSEESSRQWLWEIHDEYRLEYQQESSGIITAEPRLHFYEPLRHPELPAQLANLHNASDTATLEFVQQYGFLGHGRLLGIKRLTGRTATGTHTNLTGEDAEPIEWIRSHARNMWYILRFLNEIESLYGASVEEEYDIELLTGFLLPREEPTADWAMEHAAYLHDKVTSTLFDGSEYGYNPGFIPIRQLLQFLFAAIFQISG